MTPRHGPKVVIILVTGSSVKGYTNFVRDTSRHRSNKDDATSITESKHLLSSRLRCVQHTIRVDVHDLCTSAIKRVLKIRTR